MAGHLVQAAGSAGPGNITLVQLSSVITQLFGASAWSPTTTTLPGVAAGDLVLFGSGYWDSQHGAGNAQGVPTDNNGTFSTSAHAFPNLPTGAPPQPGWPVAPGLGYILSAVAASHILTPPVIAFGGDGFFWGMQFHADFGTAWSFIDDGQGFDGSSSPGGTGGVTVNTSGSSAQVGDLCVTVVVEDGAPNSAAVGSPTGGSGSWSNVVNSPIASNNVSVGCAWRRVTVAGSQSAIWTISDPDAQVYNGCILIMRRS